jgi:hypothetical protein
LTFQLLCIALSAQDVLFHILKQFHYITNRKTMAPTFPFKVETQYVIAEDDYYMIGVMGSIQALGQWDVGPGDTGSWTEGAVDRGGGHTYSHDISMEMGGHKPRIGGGRGNGA